MGASLDSKAMAEQHTARRQRPREYGRYILMGFALLIGALLILVAGFLEHWPFWKSGVEHLGTAIFIAAVLGLTIHIWLEKQITEDVFRAAMGYELPSELREEI